MIEDLSAAYEDFLKNGKYKEAIQVCDSDVTSERSTTEDLVGLTIATQIIRAEAKKIENAHPEMAPANLTDISESIGQEIRSLVQNLIKLSEGESPARKFAERKIKIFVEAKTVLDLIASQRWEISEWMTESFFKMLDLEDEITDEREEQYTSPEFESEDSFTVSDYTGYSDEGDDSDKDLEDSGSRRLPVMV